MSGQDSSTNNTPATSQGIASIIDIQGQSTENSSAMSQELAELRARVKALEGMARIGNRKRAREDKHLLSQPEPLSSYQTSSIRSTVEQDSSDSSEINYSARKRSRYSYTRGIKVTPSYTLKTSSSLREWGDWKRDVERLFEGDPQTYQAGSQKILKALDYLDGSLKSLWYTYCEQKGGIRKWPVFVSWTRNNVQGGQNATATLYEQWHAARQRPDQSPFQFNNYLSAIERDLPPQDNEASAMNFYSKLSRELKTQFKTSDKTIPNTRTQCVATAQRIWEGMYEHQNTGSKYPRPDSRRDRTDRYHMSHRQEERHSSAKPRENQPSVTCYNCQEQGHYSTSCPKKKEHKERRSEAKIQSVQQKEASGSPTPSSRIGSEEPTARALSPDSGSESSN